MAKKTMTVPRASKKDLRWTHRVSEKKVTYRTKPNRGSLGIHAPKVRTVDEAIDHVIDRYDEALRKLERY